MPNRFGLPCQREAGQVKPLGRSPRLRHSGLICQLCRERFARSSRRERRPARHARRGAGNSPLGSSTQASGAGMAAGRERDERHFLSIGIDKVAHYWSAPLRLEKLAIQFSPTRGLLQGDSMTERHRRHSTGKKSEVVEAYLHGEALRTQSERHDVCRRLIRIWIEKYERGAFDDDAVEADCCPSARCISRPQSDGWPCAAPQVRKPAVRSRCQIGNFLRMRVSFALHRK